MSDLPAGGRRIPFKVDIAGIIEIMGTALYSRPQTAIRELVQNAHDAIMRRRQIELSFKGRIDLRQDATAHTLSVSDDGIGLTAQEAETYLGTLGIGITGILRREAGSPSPAVAGDAPARSSGGGGPLIGQFGIGLFSAFMLADRVVVETRHRDSDQPVRWEAGAGTDVLLSPGSRATPGTTVTLHLKERYRRLAEDADPVEAAIKDYAEFVPVSIHLNDSQARLNQINATWLDPTPDPLALAQELESLFDEKPLDVIPIHVEKPVPIWGALYVTPRRTPGFSGEAQVLVTIRRMVISSQVEGLLPDWASFLRGVLELSGCSPTASREDLVRDGAFDTVSKELESILFKHLEAQAQSDPARLAALVAWHRYTLAGAALVNKRLRDLLRAVYPFATSAGTLTFAQILARSDADPITEPEADKVVWYNMDRRQEQWINSIYAATPLICVHAVRSFEEALLLSMCGDEGAHVAFRLASPGSAGFIGTVLGAQEMEDAPPQWAEHLGAAESHIRFANFDDRVPAVAFLNERRELQQTLSDLKAAGTVPPTFQKLVEEHLSAENLGKNEILLNKRHRVVAAALKCKTSHPLASVLRLLVMNALVAAGATLDEAGQRHQREDLDWIADALGPR